jgi:hypothetical protein
VNRAVPESWGTSNGTFKTKKVGDIEFFFVNYSASKKVHLRPDIVEYSVGGPKPLYDLIISKQTLHDIGAVLDFKEKTITIDDILLPMRNINNLQLKSSISRALKLISSYAQEPESTRNAPKRMVEILDGKYDKADLPSIVKNNCVHLSMPHWNLPLALLFKYNTKSCLMARLGTGSYCLSPLNYKKVLSRTMEGHTLFQKYIRPLP